MELKLILLFSFLTPPVHICHWLPLCVCVPPGAGWVAGGGKACRCATANLCQQAGPDDGHPSVWAGRGSPSAHYPGSHVAGAGLLSSHCRGSAGKYGTRGLQTHSKGWDRVGCRVTKALLISDRPSEHMVSIYHVQIVNMMILKSSSECLANKQ